MGIMLKVAEINKAEELVDVKHVLVGNTGMLEIGGETGIGLLVRLAEAGIKFRVPTFTNVISMDIDDWRKMGISDEYAGIQLKAVEAWRSMGAILSFSCMPHLCGATPKLGDHVAYSDSAPVIFANSYFGARSNRETDVVALAAAVSGRIPNFGYHLDENRSGEVLVNITTNLKEEADYDVLGCFIGRKVRHRVPVFKNMDQGVSPQSLMQLGATLAASGTVSLFHCFGITPEIRCDPYVYGEKNITEEITVTDDDMRSVYRELNTTSESTIDLVFIGCPHPTIEKLRYIASVLGNRKVSKDIEVWISVSNVVRELAARTGDLQRIEESGAKVLVGTCVVCAPTAALGFRRMATDSAKAQIYMSDFGVNVRFGTTHQCLEAALNGYWVADNV